MKEEGDGILNFNCFYPLWGLHKLYASECHCFRLAVELGEESLLPNFLGGRSIKTKARGSCAEFAMRPFHLDIQIIVFLLAWHQRGDGNCTRMSCDLAVLSVGGNRERRGRHPANH